MKIAIIEYADHAEIAEFMEDENGRRLLFESYDEADSWLMDNAECGHVYKLFGPED